MQPRARIHVATAVTVLLVLIAGGTFAYRYLEGWTWIECFYFSVMTLTTIGYGDIHPTHDISRLFTAFYGLVGVGVAFTTLGVLGLSYLQAQERWNHGDRGRS